MFKEKIKFKIYTVYFIVGISVINGEETIVVVSNRYDKPKVYIDIDDYIQQIHQDLQGIWRVLPKNPDTQNEFKQAINLINSHHIYCFSELCQQKLEQGVSKTQMKKDFPISIKRLNSYFRESK